MENNCNFDFIQKETFGKSQLGQSLQLFSIKKGNPNQALLLIGRQHPPEVPGGTISYMVFVEELLSDSKLAQTFRDRFEIICIPLLNPDGVDAGFWRHNANGKDLNRDWILFSQPETQAVRDWVKQSKHFKDKTFRYGIDFHTSHSGPYLLTLDTVPHPILPKITNKWIELIENKIASKLDIRPRKQSLPYCYNWMINELGMEAVTYEEGDEIDRSVVKQRGRDYAKTLMEILLLSENE